MHGPGNLNKTKKNEKNFYGFFNIPFSAWKIFQKIHEIDLFNLTIFFACTFYNYLVYCEIVQDREVPEKSRHFLLSDNRF